LLARSPPVDASAAPATGTSPLMVWQYLLRGWIQQAATQKLHEAAAEAVREHSSGASTAGAADLPEGETLACDIGFVYALGIEMGGLEDKLEMKRVIKAGGYKIRHGKFQNRTVAMIESGPGREAAAKATSVLIAGHRPNWIVSTGFAGGLVEGFARRDFLLASEIVDRAGGKLLVDFQVSSQSLAATPHVRVGRLITVDEIVRTKPEKLALGVSAGAMAVDMETYAVAEVCRKERVRFMSVRIISDGVDDELPKEVERLLGMKSTAGRIGAALGAIVNRPGSVKDLWKLKEDAIRASDRLAKFLEGIVAQLPADKPS